ncbi:MAG: hypothetical protein Q8M24_11255 [Pseudolabrys sp.]|nr:hypothetical protein [Pseudolabrys sp.]
MKNETNKQTVEGRFIACMIVLGGFLVLLGIQGYIGTSAQVLFFCGLTITFSMVPYLLYGRSLYAILPVLFMLRYVGVALIGKTLYWQTLDSHLSDPITSYGLAMIFIVSVTIIMICVRNLDSGKSIFPVVSNVQKLRVLATVAAIVGMASQIVIIAVTERGSGAVNTGAVFVISSALSKLYFLGLCGECVAVARQTEGKKFVSLRLLTMLFLSALLALGVNGREFFADCVLTVGVTAFLLGALRWRHILGGVLIIWLGVMYLSPAFLAMRSVREGKTGSEFINLGINSLMRILGDSEYRESLRQTQRDLARRASGSLPYDYYGDGSNILNRLSFVALLDAVSFNAQRHVPIGFEALSQVYSRVVPSFLVSEKQEFGYVYGDWLSWNIGLAASGRSMSANFGLPMEGLAVFGIGGFLLYPWLFIFPVMLVIARLSSFRKPSLMSVFLFSYFQHPLVEANSDGFINILVRGIPIILLTAGGVYWVSLRGFAYYTNVANRSMNSHYVKRKI